MVTGGAEADVPVRVPGVVVPVGRPRPGERGVVAVATATLNTLSYRFISYT